MKKLLLIALATLSLLMNSSILASSPSAAMPEQAMPNLTQMLKKVMPAVVNINVLGELPPVQIQLNIPGTKPQQGTVTPRFQSVGSGVIVDAKKGYIVTNAHVLKDAKLITVTLSNGIRLKAKKIGIDEPTDIAVLQVKSTKLTELPFANSNALQVGDFVAAIGNPFGLHQTVTSGVVSALHRDLGIEGPDGYENFIQTDAPINPGNSGGALVDLQGDLVGINTAILAPERVNIGIGFAIPSNMVKQVMEQLIKYGKVNRGIIGVMVQDLTPALADGLGLSSVKGALVTHVLPGSPAAEAGIKAQDIIEKINDEAISTAAQLRNTTGILPVGSKLKLTVLRAGKTITATATIADAKIVENHQTIKVPPLLDGVRLEAVDLLDPTMGHVRGLAVIDVDETSEAWLDGLRAGDVILQANDKLVSDIEQITNLANTSNQLLLKVQRAGGVLFLVISE